MRRHLPRLAPEGGPECTLPRMNQRRGVQNVDFQDRYERDYAAPRPDGMRGPGPQGPTPPPRQGGGVPYDSGPVRPRRGRRFRRLLISLLVLLLLIVGGTYFWIDSNLRKEVDLGKVVDRPGEGEGTNYLIVGSDSREGMSKQEEKDLHTGAAEGRRTDSMMILHVGAGDPTLISLPRDSNVNIPSFRGSESGQLRPAMGANKLNAAYAFDGPQLLTRTVEYNTGLHIDHYAEIGFAGFANVVDAMGGVDMKLDKGFQDKWSGADFQAGEQTLDGKQALAYVRTRHAFSGSDLDRTKNQQKFLSTLSNQAASPSTALNPFKLYPLMNAGLDTLVVDKEMNPYQLGRMFLAMKGVNGGQGKSMNMPISGSVGGNLAWDMPKVKQLVKELRSDEPVTVSDER
ncbi:LCP family protein [Streptomyces sp. NPDC059897]|uniref:LCP family protein n=1 Tax=Streptomyces sp. NPDC059897 TaxID=3346994 RepID=UPI00365FD1BE